MPKVKTFSERYNRNLDNSENQLTNISEDQAMINNEILNQNNNSQDEINFNLNSQDELTNCLNILESVTGIRSVLLVNRILTNALLDQDENYHLIKLFRTILKDEKSKLNDLRIKELEKAKNQKLLEMKKIELETLAYALVNR